MAMKKASNSLKPTWSATACMLSSDDADSSFSILFDVMISGGGLNITFLQTQAAALPNIFAALQVQETAAVVCKEGWSLALVADLPAWTDLLLHAVLS